MSSARLVPRTISELLLYTQLHPCAHCDTDTSGALELEIAAPTLHVYSGRCDGCGEPRRYEFQLPPAWDDANSELGTEQPSTIITYAELLALAVAAEAQVSQEPGQLEPADYFAAYEQLWHARRYLKEAAKLPPPSHSSATDVAARIKKLTKIEAVYKSLETKMTDARNRGKAAAPPPFDRARRDAHKRWLVGGKSGDGRLIMEGNRLSERMDALELDGARFVGCELVKARFDSSQLNGAEFVDCHGKGLFASAQLVGARFEACNLTGSDMRRARLDEAIINGGTWTAVLLERGELRNAQVIRADFRDGLLHDCVLDGTVFLDCDFRGASLSVRDPSYKMMGGSTATRFVGCDLRGASFTDRKLDGTVFEGCRFHGVTGKPRVLGSYSVIAPDFSKAGDGSDVRDAAAVYALWGTPN